MGDEKEKSTFFSHFFTFSVSRGLFNPQLLNTWLKESTATVTHINHLNVPFLGGSTWNNSRDVQKTFVLEKVISFL